MTVPSSWNDRRSAWSFTIRNTANSPYCETWAVCNGSAREKLGRYGYGGSFYGKICISLTQEPTYSNHGRRLIFYLGLWWTDKFHPRGGCPTIPHDHSMCLHHPVGAYLCVLSTTIFPYKSRKSKKKSTSVTPTPEKTSVSAFSSKVCSTKVKLEIRNSKN